MKRTILKNIFFLCVLLFIVYLIVNYAGQAKNYIFAMFNISGSSVQGASTQKAEEITNKFQSDIANGFTSVKEQALQISLGDMVGGLYRLQKIPQDVHVLQEYVKGQIESVIESRK